MTNPLPSALAEKLKSGTAWRFSVSLGTVFKPRFFCCTDPNELGIVGGKEPVAVIQASPNPVFAGGTVAFDGTGSYDPDGSITEYSWSFAGGSPSSSTNSTENVTFASAGDRTVRLTVTDGTGKRSVPAQVVIRVLGAGDGFGTDGEAGAAGGGVYVASESGPLYSADSGQNWTYLNNGLTGSQQNVFDIKQKPATFGLPQANHILFIAAEGGVLRSVDGGQNWTDVTPDSVTNVDNDTPGPTIADLSFNHLVFFGDRIYVAGVWTNASGLYRSRVFYADSTAESLSWSEVV